MVHDGATRLSNRHLPSWLPDRDSSNVQCILVHLLLVREFRSAAQCLVVPSMRIVSVLEGPIERFDFGLLFFQS
jgi:hypothetical protein